MRLQFFVGERCQELGRSRGNRLCEKGGRSRPLQHHVAQSARRGRRAMERRGYLAAADQKWTVAVMPCPLAYAVCTILVRKGQGCGSADRLGGQFSIDNKGDAAIAQKGVEVAINRGVNCVLTLASPARDIRAQIARGKERGVAFVTGFSDDPRGVWWRRRLRPRLRGRGRCARGICRGQRRRRDSRCRNASATAAARSSRYRLEPQRADYIKWCMVRRDSGAELIHREADGISARRLGGQGHYHQDAREADSRRETFYTGICDAELTDR